MKVRLKNPRFKGEEKVTGEALSERGRVFVSWSDGLSSCHTLGHAGLFLVFIVPAASRKVGDAR